jgi:tRNA pseudouridine55 synthase
VDGVLVVDKPAGPTSHDMVDRVRQVLGLRRVGHTGTLDPFATGVLPLCLGKATRLARFLGTGEKVYQATVRLGFATSTDDLSGTPVSEVRPVDLDEDEIRHALTRLEGSYDQVPPAYSARHVEGRRLYELARRGEAAPRPARPVTVHGIRLLAMNGDQIEIEVRCSTGTYIRALARDLGAELGPGGHLTALRRTRSGSFGLEHSVRVDDLARASERVMPLGALLPELPAVRVGEAGRRLVRHGRDLERASTLAGFPETGVERVRIVDESGALLALGVPRVSDAGAASPHVEPTLHPEVVLVD